jgi:hypothetical protein
MKEHIIYTISSFIKHKPDIWRLMDARFNVMAKIIIGGSNALVKYILFGDGSERNPNLHIPRLYRWDEKEDKFKECYKNSEREKMNIEALNDLQIAIRLCKQGILFCINYKHIYKYSFN